MKTQVYAGIPTPPMVKRILLLLVGIWLLQLFAAKFGGVDLAKTFALTPLKVFPGFQIWQLFTWMWLHGYDLSHILFNGLFLWMFGGNLELAWGSRAFLRFYLTCGIGSGLVVFMAGLLFDPAVPVLGASGAIYGLVVAWAIIYPNRLIYFFGIFPIKGKHFVLIPIGYALIDFLTSARGISHAAHLGGMAIGALLVTGFWRPEKLIPYVRAKMAHRHLHLAAPPRRPSPSSPPGGGYWQ